MDRVIKSFNVSRVYQYVNILRINYGAKVIASRGYSTNVNTVQEGVPFNYYDIKDERDSIETQGLSIDDPRAKWKSKDDSTEGVDYNDTDSGDGIILNKFDNKVPLYKRCKITGMLVRVDIKVNELKVDEAVNALLYNFPNISIDSDIKELYSYLKGVDKRFLMDREIINVKAIQHHIQSLLNYHHFTLRHSIAIVLILDHLGVLTHELRNRILLSIQSNLHELTPYDIAAAIDVYGKIRSRYHSFINTLGLVFYDIMLGGKTSICPNGPSIDEIITALASFTNIEYPMKKITDPIFGTLYEHINDLTVSQMVFSLKSFFTLSKDPNFVEFFSQILSILFKQPLLYIENFQEYAQEQLNRNFNLHPTISRYDKEYVQSYDYRDLVHLFDAMAKCNSEFLISAIHYRIEFKRLWAHNISIGNMPWRLEGILPSTGEAENEDNTNIITYKDQLPQMFHSVANIISGIFGPQLSCKDIVEYIVHHNSRVTNKLDGDGTIRFAIQTHYPFISSIRRALFDVENVEFPLLKGMDIKYPLYTSNLRDENALSFHIYNLSRSTNEQGSSDYTHGIEVNSWINEVVDGITLGNFGFANKSLLPNSNDGVGFVNFADVKLADVSNCISLINDYSRYVDSNHVDLLAGLYYRLLFITPRETVDTYISVLNNITPNCLLLDNLHLPYINDGNTEFYYVNGNFNYYKPSLPLVSLFSSDCSLNGLVLYVISNYIQYAITPALNELSEPQIVNTTSMLRHLLCPVYTISRIEEKPSLIWNLVYFTGMLNERLKLRANLADFDKIRDRCISCVNASVDAFQHIYISFINVVSQYFNTLLSFLNDNYKILSVFNHVRVLETILMFKHCTYFLKDVHIGVQCDLSKYLKMTNAVLLNKFNYNDVNLVQLYERYPSNLLNALSDMLCEGGEIHDVVNVVLKNIYDRISHYSTETLISILPPLGCLKGHYSGLDTECSETLEYSLQFIEMGLEEIIERLDGVDADTISGDSKRCLKFLVQCT